MRKQLFRVLTTLLIATWLVTACGGGAPAGEQAQEQAQETAGEAQEAAEQAKEAVEQAQEVVGEAQEAAQEAVEQAQETVEQTQEAVEQAQETVGEAQKAVAEELPAAASEPSAAEVETGFPLLDDASNIQALNDANSTINYQTNATLAEIAEFYQQTLSEQVLIERSANTVISDQVVNLVFDGAANGKSVVVQAIPLGDVRNVNVRYE